MIVLKGVDVPAPFGPMSPVIVPSRTERVQPSRAFKPPNAFTTSCVSRMPADGGVARVSILRSPAGTLLFSHGESPLADTAPAALEGPRLPITERTESGRPPGPGRGGPPAV